MERLITQAKIQSYLTRLEDLLIISNTNGENTLTKICENLIRELFNIIYNEDFQNTNLHLGNYPAVDLQSLSSRTAIQVTSNRTSTKITETFDSFFKHKLDKEYSDLKIVILTTKGYNAETIKSNFKRIAEKYNTTFSIDIEKSIITLPTIYSIISNLSDINDLNKIRILFEKNFDEITKISELSSYYETLKELFFEKVMDNEYGITLNSIYIDPYFSIHESSVNKLCPDISPFRGGNQYKIKTKLSIHELLNAKYQKNNKYDDYFANPNANTIFILGYPGQGKTSLCSKLLFDILTQPQKKPIFYVKLRNISDTKVLINNPFTCIFNELEGIIDSEITKSMLKNSITILDGLDELYMKDNLNANDIEVFCKGIIHETEKFKNWEVLITSRHGYINFDKMFKENYIALNIESLELAQQLHWLKKYQKFDNSTWLTEDKLIKINHDQSDSLYLKELIAQPLLLYILTTLENEIDISSDRSEIYNLLFDQIIERKYSKDGQIENLKNLTKEDLRILLQEIAFLIFVKGTGYVTESDILNEEIFEDFLTSIGNKALSETLKGILISFYFTERKLQGDEAGKVGIEFFHKSLQEYLTAEKIVNTIFNDFLNKDKKEKYILSKGEDMLKKLGEIFGIHKTTNEIEVFMKELIKKRSNSEKMELAERLCLNVDYFFKNDFLCNHILNNVEPLTKISFIFSSYWSFLQALNQKIDLIKSDSYRTNKFFTYTNLVQNIPNFHLDSTEISHQNFNDSHTLNFTNFEQDIHNVSFTDCTFDLLTFGAISVIDMSLSNCYIASIKLYNAYIQKLFFSECDFEELYMNLIQPVKQLSFNKCEFHEKIYIKGRKSNTITFTDCIFYEESFENLKIVDLKIKFQNCILRKYSTVKRGVSNNIDYFIVDKTWDLIEILGSE